jgi:hypothetical protein
MEENDSNQIDLSVLPFVEDAIGATLLAYLLRCATNSLQSIISGDGALTEQQVAVINTLSALRQALPEELDGDSKKELVRAWLTQVGGDDRSVARSLREHTGRVDEIPSGRDDIENALLTLAADAYPAFLLPPEPIGIPMMEDVSFRVTSLVHNHPQSRTFSEAALRDPVLGNVFAIENEHTGRTAMVYRNTGSGGGLQLVMLPELALRAAWRHLQDQDASPGAFATEAIERKHSAAARRCSVW